MTEAQDKRLRELRIEMGANEFFITPSDIDELKAFVTTQCTGQPGHVQTVIQTCVQATQNFYADKLANIKLQLEEL